MRAKLAKIPAACTAAAAIAIVGTALPAAAASASGAGVSHFSDCYSDEWGTICNQVHNVSLEVRPRNGTAHGISVYRNRFTGIDAGGAYSGQATSREHTVLAPDGSLRTMTSMQRTEFTSAAGTCSETWRYVFAGGKERVNHYSGPCEQ